MAAVLVLLGAATAVAGVALLSVEGAVIAAGALLLLAGIDLRR